ncbi:flagellar transcriptional regulator FlhD [Paraburkholderia sp. Ac-20336]|nr:flagellar transcriptional regulator FlhD [Paraburkholderia sp. Ac-20336]MBN3850226.1 flagellar transcriptional regulator FlhD [Paraburkholderia sp. Ac-20342]
MFGSSPFRDNACNTGNEPIRTLRVNAFEQTFSQNGLTSQINVRGEIMSTNSDMLNEIREVNLSYLLLAQRLLREDKPMGMFRMGISDQLAEVIANLSLAQTVKLAASNQMLCRFRFDDHAVLSALADKDKASVVAQAHSAILMASQPVEQLG